VAYTCLSDVQVIRRSDLIENRVGYYFILVYKVKIIVSIVSLDLFPCLSMRSYESSCWAISIEL